MQYKMAATLLAPDRKHKEPWLVLDGPTFLKVFSLLRLYSMRVKYYFLHYDLPFPKECKKGRQADCSSPGTCTHNLPVPSKELQPPLGLPSLSEEIQNTHDHRLQTATL